MCKPELKIKKRDLEFMSPEEISQVLSDEIFLCDPEVSPYAGQHESNVNTIRAYMAAKYRAIS